ncbi:MAG: right-handed parallel beta-helix repeat-containing protein [Acidobacteria bacterium]|nr:right-handed parallel beta-helix repeat-containing protein [Acidobacteriota bacterium]
MRRVWLDSSWVALLLVVLAAGAQAEVLTVGPPPARFQSLQEAITASRAGDTIRVYDGTNIGQFILDKQLILEGVGKPVLRGTGQGSVVVVTADHCAIRGFIIEHSGRDLQAEDSGLLLKSNDNTVEDNELRDVLYGIYLFHSQRNIIRRNTVYGRRELELGGQGDYPRLRLYLNSPAAQALATAEKTFPIVRGSMEADTAPLTKAVAVHYSFERAAKRSAVQMMLGIASLAMFGAAIVIVWKGQR